MTYQRLTRMSIIIILILLFSIFIQGPISQVSEVNNHLFAQKKKAKTRKKRRRRRRRVRKFALNFKDVDISEFVGVMSQLIKKNIVLDDKVRGKITISSPRRVPVSEAYNIMKTILEVKGLAVVETRNMIKVVPIGDAIKQNIEIIIDDKKKIAVGREKTITYLMEIKNADADEISRSLKSLKSKNTQIIVHRTLNTIIFSGRSKEIKGLVEIANELDQSPDGDDPIAKGNINVVHLENANAEELANVLSRIPFSDSARINTSPLRPKIRKSQRGKRLTKKQTRTVSKKGKHSIIAYKETNSLIITAKPNEFHE